MISIGLDVGGTKILGVAIDPDDPGVLRSERRVATPDGGLGLVDTLCEVLGALIAPDEAPAVLGVGVPGLIDREGRLRMGPHLGSLRDLPLAEMLTERSGIVTVVDNDANCHAVAEQTCGAAAGVDEALVVTFGTGIGAGVITRGRLVRGANGFAGEPGHTIVDRDGLPCPCGQRGCWEQYASGTGLANLARVAANEGRIESVIEAAGGDPEAVRGEHITAAARAGDADATRVMDELAGWMALGLANLTNVLDPAVVVLGGGLVDAADLLLPRLREDFGRFVMGGDRRPTVTIVPAVLGERAGAIGAAVLAAESA
ncbi:MAG: ROK family protein [Acidimicrobiales bacterium]